MVSVISMRERVSHHVGSPTFGVIPTILERMEFVGKVDFLKRCTFMVSLWDILEASVFKKHSGIVLFPFRLCC